MECNNELNYVTEGTHCSGKNITLVGALDFVKDNGYDDGGNGTVMRRMNTTRSNRMGTHIS